MKEILDALSDWAANAPLGDFVMVVMLAIIEVIMLIVLSRMLFRIIFWRRHP